MKLVDYDETQDLKIVGNVSFSGDGGKAMEDQTLLLLKLFWLDDSVHKIVRKSSYDGAELDLNPSVRMISSVAEPGENGVTGFSFVAKLAAKDYRAGDVVEMTTSSSLMNFVSRGAFNLTIPKDDKFEDWVDAVSVQLFDKTETTTLGEKFGIGNKVFLPKGMQLNGVELKKHTWIRVIDSSHVVGYDVGTDVQLPNETATTLGERFGWDVTVKLPVGTQFDGVLLTESMWVYIVSPYTVGYDVGTDVKLPGEQTDSTLGTKYGKDVYVKLPAGTILNCDEFDGSWNGIQLVEDTWVRIEEVSGDGVGYGSGTSVQLPNETATTLGERFGWDVYVKLPAGTVLGSKTLGSDTAVYIVSPYTVAYDVGTSVKLPGEQTDSFLGVKYGKDVYVKLPAGTILGGKILTEETWIQIIDTIFVPVSPGSPVFPLGNLE